MFSFFIGIDVSKDFFDVSTTSNGEINYLGQFSNDEEGFLKLMVELSSICKLDITRWFFCFEHTGAYSFELRQFLQSYDINCLEENALQINRSLGIRKGKSDKTDSKDICQYAFEKRASLKVSPKMDVNVSKLKRLVLKRDILNRKLSDLKVSFKTTQLLCDEEISDFFSSINSDVIKALKDALEKVEKKIEEVINADKELKTNSDLAQTVIGIGRITSAFIIAYTNNFKLITDPRKFASFSGIAPFSKNSGNYTARARVSHIANKKIKSLLSICVSAAKNYDPQLKRYAARKKAEGKPNVVINNNIRNKLVQRVFAVVKRKQPYIKFEYA